MLVAPRLRASAFGFFAPRHRLRKIGSAPLLCGREESTPCSGRLQRLLDEPFPIRDSQFNYPHVAVLRHAPVQIVVKI